MRYKVALKKTRFRRKGDMRLHWWIGVLLTIAGVMSIGASSARADVIYTLTGSTNPAFGPVHSEDFQFTSTDFITSSVSLAASDLNSCVACAPSGTAVQFFPYGTVPVVAAVNYISFTDANGVVYGFFFDAGDFSTPGTYTASSFLPYIVSNSGTLTVEQTPEPSTLLLLGIGMLGVIGPQERRQCRLGTK